MKKSPPSFPTFRRIGGPDTLLPFWLESLFSWLFAISCLTVALYHWVRQRLFYIGGNKRSNNSPKQQQQQLPLTTYCQRELTNVPPMERCHQFQQLLETVACEQKNQNAPRVSCEDLSDLEWIQAVRSHSILRRLATILMIHSTTTKTMQSDDCNSLVVVCQSTTKRLLHIWPHLLPMPSSPTCITFAYEISIIMPAYNENGAQLKHKLQVALEQAKMPLQIEVLIVDAGKCTNLESVLDLSSNDNSDNNNGTNSNGTIKLFANIQCIPNGIGGRGPCLNLGASKAQGRILTFLHADTRLTHGWDAAIRKAFDEDNHKLNNKTQRHQTASRKSIACAFSFAIDTSSEGLNGGPYPPGIRAIEATANLRSHWFSLPYGDQCLSLPRLVFDYLGGFPDQCLMEDYELVKLLRMRTTLEPEQLQILDTKAYCSPRRWQLYGVLYVTYMNSHCVTLYSHGQLSPDELFQLYYKSPVAPQRQDETYSPWELELKRILTEEGTTK